MICSKEGSSANSRPRRPNPDLIIKGGTIITMVEEEKPVLNAKVYIADGAIMGIIGEEEEPHQDCYAEVIDAEDSIIMPGLINAHTHLAMTLFRGFADDLPLKQWLFEKIFPAEAKFLNPETVYCGALLGCLELIASGTTCLVDGYFFQDETARAVHEAGLRGLIAQGVVDFPAPGVEDPKMNLKVAEDFIEKWLSYSELIIPGMFCHSPLTCSDRTLMGALDISKAYGLPLQIHLSETISEVNEIIKNTGKKPVHYLDQLGLIHDNLIAAHAIHLDESEIECLKMKGVKVVYVPESNMKLCSGVCKVCEMVRMGLTIGLGTDGCASNNNLDLFGEMDTAAKLAKVMSFNSTGIDAKTVLKMTTSWGAAVLGLEKKIGTLERGKKADIIVVDLKSPHLCPLYSPESSVVYSASGADVKDVIVNGKILMKDRKFMTLDPEEIMAKARKISKKIAET